MTPDEFRALALSFPETSESSHMNHPDFRVGGKIFATLGPDLLWGVVKLSPDQQEVLIQAEPAVFTPAAGAWGQRGYTRVTLAAARAESVHEALTLAWYQVAPKRLRRATGST